MAEANNTDNEIFTRSQCTFYESWEDAISILKKKERDVLRCAIIRSLLYGENFEKDIEKLTKAAKIAWKTIVPLIKSARNRSKGGSVSKVNNPNGNNQYTDNNVNNGNNEDKIEDKIEDKVEDKVEDKNIKKNIKIKNKCVSRTRTREGNLSPEDEKRLIAFDNLLAEKAPTFAKSVPPLSLKELNELKNHASSNDIIEVMEEIENKVAMKKECPYSVAATTIKIFLQTKNKWKNKE